MTEILKAYKFRIYPDAAQTERLNRTFGCVRVLWNKLVENFNNYGTEKYQETYSEKEIKLDDDLFFLRDVSAASLQQKRQDFVETKKQFFNVKRKVRLGRMRFKRKIARQSYRLPNQKFSLDQNNSTIRLEKIGHVPVVLDRKLPEDTDYRSVTVSKTPSGKFYVSVLVREIVEPLPLTGKKIGIDVGINSLFSFSNGHAENNPKWFRKNQTKLARAQKCLARKIKGSNRYTKQRIKVATIYETIANQRKDFLHKMTTRLVKEFDVICVEDLSVKNMVKNRKLSKSIHDASWSEFFRQLSYKCSWYGKTLVAIDRFYPSSKLCSECGHKAESMPLNIREWDCSNCNSHHDRDTNAAVNILKKGFSLLTGISVESIEYKRGELVSLPDSSSQVADSMKRLDVFIETS